MNPIPLAIHSSWSRREVRRTELQEEERNEKLVLSPKSKDAHVSSSGFLGDHGRGLRRTASSCLAAKRLHSLGRGIQLALESLVEH